MVEKLLALQKRDTPPRVHRIIERSTVPRDDDVSLKLIQDLH